MRVTYEKRAEFTLKTLHTWIKEIEDERGPCDLLAVDTHREEAIRTMQGPVHWPLTISILVEETDD